MGEIINTTVQSGYESAMERISEISKLVNQVNNFGAAVGTKSKEVFSNVMSELSKLKVKQELQFAIHQAASEHNIDPKLINAVIEQESNFNPTAVSESGALGLMQIMPGTAQELGIKDPLNPQENIRGGTKYLSSLLNRYQGNVILALSAYNAGPRNVDKYKGVPPFSETKNYIKGVIDKLT